MLDKDILKAEGLLMVFLGSVDYFQYLWSLRKRELPLFHLHQNIQDLHFKVNIVMNIAEVFQ